MSATTVTLIAKPGCHLCDDARAVVDRVLGELEQQGVAIRLVERNILEDPQLAARYADDIPVVLVDERMHGRWRIDADALEADLLR
ncbi:MAG TPA: glutaredoxin family protein [Amnibacterium sp.]|nr:glutaredoxin family protein [Amnibacterium sp.]